jgi:hypothetical protein
VPCCGVTILAIASLPAAVAAAVLYGCVVHGDQWCSALGVLPRNIGSCLGIEFDALVYGLMSRNRFCFLGRGVEAQE